MRALTVLLMLATTPALGEECRRYVSGFDLGSIEFQDGEGHALFQSPGAEPVVCGFTLGDETGNDLSCEDGTEGQFSFASATYGGEDQAELLIYGDHVWYRRCE